MENNSQIIIYQTETGETKLEVRLENETVWLTQKLMAELFQTTIPNINIHLKNIFDEGELNPKATIKDFLIVRLDGNREVNRSELSQKLGQLKMQAEDGKMRLTDIADTEQLFRLIQSIP